MPTTLQLRRYDTANIANLTGAVGEVFIDMDKDTIVVQDGSTAGGFALARENVTQGAYIQANSAYNEANSATQQSNLAREQANNARDQANTARNTANDSYGQANAAYGQANSAYGQANAAYSQANLKLNLTGGDINGSLNISGNLFVSGNTSYINVSTFVVDDALIYLASNNILSDIVDIGFVAAKNSGPLTTHTGLARDAGDSTWYLFDGLPDAGHQNNVIDFANTTLATLRANINANSILLTGNAVATQANLTLAHNTANDAYAQANGAYSQANAAYAQANSAYAEANLKLNIAGGTINGNLIVSGNLEVLGNSTVLNVETLYVEDNEIVLNSSETGLPTSNAFLIINRGASQNASIKWDESTSQWKWDDGQNIFYAFDSALDAYTQANTARNTANDAFGAANNSNTNALNAYTQANTARNVANTAYGQANDAFTQANTARGIASNAYGQANDAYAQANTARDLANTVYGDANTRVLRAGDTMTGALNVGSHISANVFRSTNTTLSGPSISTFDGERLRLYDFQQAGHPNYAIGVEGSHIWMGVDDIGPTLGFKWYGNTTQVGLLRTNSTFEVSNTVQGKVLKATGTGTAVDASQGNILTNEVTGTKFKYLAGLYTVTVDASGATSNYTFNLPPTGGVVGQVLETDGNGDTVWSSNVYSLANTVYAQANDAYGQANTARTTANDAYGQANTARTTANDAYAQANTKLASAGGTVTGTLNVDATLIVQNVEPNLNVTYNLGSPTKRFKDLYLSNNTLFLGETVISADGDEMKANTFNAAVSFLSGGLNVLDQANSARNQANTARDTANGAYGQANGAYAQANGAYAQANIAYGQANDAYSQANTARLTANDAYTAANNAKVTVYANSGAANATTQTINFVNTSTVLVTVANTAGNANIELSLIGTPYDQANTARDQANNAYAEANLKLNLTGGTLTGSLNINGDLSISNGNVYLSGNTTYINVSTFSVDDALIYLGANNTISDTIDLGFVAAKNSGPSTTHTGLARDAGDGTWYLFDGLPDAGHTSNVIDFANTNLATLRANINANSILWTGNAVATQANLTLAHDQANTARNTANDSYSQANGAYGQANAAYNQANTARTTANDAYTAANNAKVTVFANSGAANATTQTINFVNTSTILVTVANTAGNANIEMAIIGTPYDQANTARDTANGAYSQANGAYAQANGAYAHANIAYTQANNAYTTANAAVIRAGDTMTGILVVPGIRNTKNTVDQTNANTNTNGANNINLDESNFFTRTLTASCAFTFRNAPASGNAHSFTLVVVQDGNGSRTPSFTNTVYWAGGTIPPATTTASARDVWQFVTFDGGTTYYGTLSIKGAA